MAGTRWLIAAVLICGSLGWSASSLAADADPFDGRLLPLELVMAHRKEIDLTKAQSKRIGELVVALQKEVADKQWRMQSAYFDLMVLLDEPVVDEAQSLLLAKQAVDTENEIKLEQMRFLIRLRNELTPEQVGKLRARRATAGG